jgi:hypothetical protein
VEQFSYAALWDFAQEIQSGIMTLENANAQCQSEAARLAKAKRKAGFKISRTTLKGQTREWWRLGEPCGLSCNMYIVNVFGFVGTIK